LVVDVNGRVVGALVTAFVVALTSLLGVAPAHADTSWTFVGTYNNPPRGNYALEITGDFTAPVDVTASFYLKRVTTPTSSTPDSIPMLSSTGYPHLVAGVTQTLNLKIDSQYVLPPVGGTYNFVVNDGAGSADVVLLGPITIVSPVKSVLTTLSSTNEVRERQRATFRMVSRATWPDGVVTDEPPYGVTWYSTFLLQVRPVGYAQWIDLATSGTPEITLELGFNGTYRMLLDKAVGTSVAVKVHASTLYRRFSKTKVTPMKAARGSLITVSTNMETKYDDNTWHPTPDFTQYEIEWLPSGATAWRSIAAGRLSQWGTLTRRIPMPGSGQLRLTSGYGISSVIRLTAIKSTSTIALGALTIPTSAVVNSTFVISATSTTKYTDGIYRPTPVGTSYEVDFAPAPTSGSALRWTVVTKAKTKVAGVVSVRVTATRTGYWRLVVLKKASAAHLVRVTKT